MDKKAALLIANSEYDDPSFRTLKAPTQDVKTLARVLSDPNIGGFSVETLLNRPKDEIVLAIQDFFEERNRADLLLLYFSCHGAKDKDGRLYYAAKNTRQNRLLATGVAAYQVNDLISKSASRRKILVLDCCYSGAFSKAFLAKGAVEVGALEEFDQGQGLVTLTASDAFQTSLEEEDAGNADVCSVFTRALVDGIETGKADRDDDQLISLDELYDYAYDHVRRVNPHQSPRKQGEVEGKIFVARNPQPPRPAELPPGLVQNTKDPDADVRVIAVRKLGELLGGRNRGMALTAQAALLRLTKDDSSKVKSAARKALKKALEEEAQSRPEPAASTELEMAQEEAQEQARKQQEQAIAKGRNDAAALLAVSFHSGDFRGPIAILEALVRQYPDSADARGDLDAAVSALEYQKQEAIARAAKRVEGARLEAEEQARKQQEQAIAQGRNDAAALFGSSDFQGAIATLDKLIEQYPDSADARRDRDDAASAFARQQQEANARAEKQAEEIARAEAEEQARKQQEQAIAKGRNDAAALFHNGDFQGTIATLDKLIERYPDNADARTDRDAAASAFARQQQEAKNRVLMERLHKMQAEERARREAEAAKGRNDAAALFRNGDFQGAIAILDALMERYPDSADVRKDREAAASALARQQQEAKARAQKQAEERARREAEEQARKQREQAIGKGRNDAEALFRSGNFQGAVAILDALIERYPDSTDARSDRETAASALARQQQEAALRKAAEQAKAGRATPGKAQQEALAPPAPGTSYASFGSRAAAYLIDLLIVAFFSALVSRPMSSGNPDADSELLGFLFLVTDCLYQTTTIGGRRQATWGMRVARIFVSDEKGHRLSFRRAAARYAAAKFLWFGYFMQPFTKSKQALHDMIVKSVVWRRSA